MCIYRTWRKNIVISIQMLLLKINLKDSDADKTRWCYIVKIKFFVVTS